MYKLFTTHWINFYTLEQLVNYISQYNYGNGTEINNTILENTKVCKGDTHYIGLDEHWNYIGCYEPRTYMILNPDNISMYNKDFVKIVHNWKFNEQILQEWKVQMHGRPFFTWWALRERDLPEFRRGPVPFIHCYHGCNYYRHIATTNEIKQTTAPEMTTFNRGSRGHNLPDVWSAEPVRYYNKNWKAQGKHRHQWDNNVLTTEKHRNTSRVYVEKHIQEEDTTKEDIE